MIYHIVENEIWEIESKEVKWGNNEIKHYGFIHSSDFIGLNKIINRYTDTDKYILLIIDEEKLKDKIVYEEKDKDHHYPHFYELLDKDVITETLSLKEFLKKNIS